MEPQSGRGSRNDSPKIEGLRPTPGKFFKNSPLIAFARQTQNPKPACPWRSFDRPIPRLSFTSLASPPLVHFFRRRFLFWSRFGHSLHGRVPSGTARKGKEEFKPVVPQQTFLSTSAAAPCSPPSPFPIHRSPTLLGQHRSFSSQCAFSLQRRHSSYFRHYLLPLLTMGIPSRGNFFPDRVRNLPPSGVYLLFVPLLFSFCFYLGPVLTSPCV